MLLFEKRFTYLMLFLATIYSSMFIYVATTEVFNFTNYLVGFIITFIAMLLYLKDTFRKSPSIGILLGYVLTSSILWISVFAFSVVYFIGGLYKKQI